MTLISFQKVEKLYVSKEKKFHRIGHQTIYPSKRANEVHNFTKCFFLDKKKTGSQLRVKTYITSEFVCEIERGEKQVV